VFDPVRWPKEAWVPLLAGVLWSAAALDGGLVWGAPALVPAIFLIASGVGMLLYPGDRRLSHFGALGGVLGVLLAVLGLLFMGAFALLLGLAAAAAFVASGRHALRLDPHPEGVPDPPASLRASAEIAIDEAILATMLFTQIFPDSSADAALRRRSLARRDRDGFGNPARHRQIAPASRHQNAPKRPVYQGLERTVNLLLRHCA
jgi:hypothetical protein